MAQDYKQDLEQTGHLAGGGIDVDAPECRIGARARHQADGAGAGAEELGPGVDEHVADRQAPALGHALYHRVMAQRQMGLDHHRGEIRILVITSYSIHYTKLYDCPCAGTISLMPGTSSNPAFRRVDVDVKTGKVSGLF